MFSSSLTALRMAKRVHRRVGDRPTTWSSLRKEIKREIRTKLTVNCGRGQHTRGSSGEICRTYCKLRLQSFSFKYYLAFARACCCASAIALKISLEVGWLRWFWPDISENAAFWHQMTLHHLNRGWETQIKAIFRNNLALPPKPEEMT